MSDPQTDARLSRIEAQLEELLRRLEGDTSRSTYLTVPQAMAYLQRTNRNGFYNFLRKQRIPRCRMGRTLLLRRVDLDRAVAPARQDP